MPNPYAGQQGGSLGAYIAGRQTPISQQLDPKTAAELREKYGQMLQNLAVAKSSLQQEAIGGYANVYANALGTVGQVMRAFGEVAQAQGSAYQAQARAVVGLLGPLSEQLADFALALPHAESKDSIDKASRAAATTAVGRINQATIQRIANEATARAPREGALDKQTVFAGLRQLMDTEFGKFATNANSHLQDAPPGVQRVNTAKHAVRQIRQDMIGVLRATAGEALPDDLLVEFADVYASTKLEPAFTGAIPQSEREAASKQQDAAIAKLQQLESKIDGYMVGMPPELKKQGLDAVSGVMALVSGGPHEWMELAGQMPTPDSMATLEKDIRKWMRDIDTGGPPDPLQAAVHRMVTQVPGFPAWMQAMRFKNPERAAIYASRHPFELQEYQRWLEKDPALAEDPSRLREMIKAKGREEGWGYFARRLERGLGFRIGLGKKPDVPEEKLPELDLTGLPEPEVAWAGGEPPPGLSDALAAQYGVEPIALPEEAPLLSPEQKAALDPANLTQLSAPVGGVPAEPAPAPAGAPAAVAPPPAPAAAQAPTSAQPAPAAAPQAATISPEQALQEATIRSWGFDPGRNTAPAALTTTGPGVLPDAPVAAPVAAARPRNAAPVPIPSYASAPTGTPVMVGGGSMVEQYLNMPMSETLRALGLGGSEGEDPAAKQRAALAAYARGESHPGPNVVIPK